MVAKTDPNALGRVRLETRRVADLVPAGYNPRTISPEALAGLGESIGRFGLVQPIIVNARTGRVVGGHQRLKVLEANGVEAFEQGRGRERTRVERSGPEETGLSGSHGRFRAVGRFGGRSPLRRRANRTLRNGPPNRP